MGSFDALTKQGSSYQNSQRFKPLQGAGKPLWEFKEHGERIYCVREVTGADAKVVLLNGWTKDKEGRGTREEDREIARAQSLYDEYQQETHRQKGRGRS